ncbi:hypothetical protein FRACYDRAFT_249401 [Fragilariopsis cylindrus CCMP1102]|uniref:Uncharacterized protein n=1 Tax=Fragilariopsis cylindrus CCMP1102 TaxID=635003 RepID=A0A1E7ERG0_9STRA|nr:hypothetical protein FRACYDRAFT_249401 [Fragilariopsis cylindrus CCMP1102]|eukprot:OEU08511.1 hypothetical protein FRACYDRAFT_249401 [Fragilariopsis cylindrus CCMP1102]
MAILHKISLMKHEEHNMEMDAMRQEAAEAAVANSSNSSYSSADHEQIMIYSNYEPKLLLKKHLLDRGRRILEQRSAEEEDWIFFVKILGTNALAKLEEDPIKKLQMWNTFLAGRQERVNATEDRVIANGG